VEDPRKCSSLGVCKALNSYTFKRTVASSHVYSGLTMKKKYVPYSSSFLSPLENYGASVKLMVSNAFLSVRINWLIVHKHTLLASIYKIVK
jgi:hypothetical protein